MIRRCEFDRVLAAIRDAGIAKEVETLINPSGVGRPRQLDVDVFLTALVLCACHRRQMYLSNIHDLLTTDLARGLQSDHRLRRGNRAITLRQVRYLFSTIAEHLTPDLRDGTGQTPEDIALDRLANMIIGAFVPDNLPTPGAYAMDGTAVQAWARGKHRPDDTDPDGQTGVGRRYSADPDARWGHCTKTYANRSSVNFGYEAFTLVGTPCVGAPTDSVPVLTYRLMLRPVALDVAEPALAMIDDAAAAGQPVTTLLADRAWSYLKPDSWREPARARGVDLVFDLHPNDRGAREDERTGVLMVDGAPHCPAMPTRLIDIPRPAKFSIKPLPPNADRAKQVEHQRQTDELAAFQTAIAERGKYAFRRSAGPDPTGKERWECPGEAGRIRCAHCPLSQQLDADTPEVADPPQTNLPTCCTQRTVTINVDVDAKRRQRHNWGTPKWIADYIRRTYVEGSYGNLKSAKTQNIVRGWCAVTGRAKTTLLLAAAVAAVNLRLLRGWADRTGWNLHPLCAADPDDHGFEELDAHGNIAPAHDPPPLAAIAC